MLGAIHPRDIQWVHGPSFDTESSSECQPRERMFTDGDGRPADDLRFGTFRLLPRHKLLLRAGQPIKLGARAMRILLLLTERSGEIVSHAELMAAVWPGIAISENALRVHMTALRKALGDGTGSADHIATAKGRGYSFVAELTRAPHPPKGMGQAPAAAHPPVAPAGIVGRAVMIARLDAQLRRDRLISIVGPGGIGKTAVALAAARGARERFAHGDHFVDLAPVSDSRLVAAALAHALGLDPASPDPMREVARHLSGSESLLVLDTCEHVIEEAARLCVALLEAAPAVRIIATSREALRVRGETVLRIPPLELPCLTETRDTGSLLRASSVQLLAERAAAIEGAIPLHGQARAAAELCIRLEGNPLGIELAAAHLGRLDCAGLLVRLSDPSTLLSQGVPTPVPRQSTLRASEEWSYRLLTETEQRILLWLGTIPGEFDLDAAIRLVASTDLAATTIIEAVASLASRSLITVTRNGAVRYRVPATTRAFALEKLQAGAKSATAFATGPIAADRPAIPRHRAGERSGTLYRP